MGTISVEIYISAPLDRVWLAWTESERITTWFAPEVKVDTRIMGSFELFFDPSDHGNMSTEGVSLLL